MTDWLDDDTTFWEQAEDIEPDPVVAFATLIQVVCTAYVRDGKLPVPCRIDPPVLPVDQRVFVVQIWPETGGRMLACIPYIEALMQVGKLPGLVALIRSTLDHAIATYRPTLEDPV